MKFLTLFLLFVLLNNPALINAAPLQAGEGAQNDDTITIVLNDWASQQINSFILGNLFEQLGLKVKYQVMTVDAQWAALTNNEVHVQVEVWEGSMANEYERLVNQKSIIDAGSYTAVSREEWWYPDYVQALCPGLPDWKALLNCSSLFSKNISDPNVGNYITGPWDDTDELRIASLGLDFVVEHVKNDKELWKKLEAAHKEKKPILLLNWSPNYIENLYKGYFVEFPAYSESCRTNPSWGINPKATHDCGNPKEAWIKKIATKQFKENNPKAFSVLERFDLSGSQFSELIYVKEVLGVSDKRVAEIWLSKNKKLWKSWLAD